MKRSGKAKENTNMTASKKFTISNVSSFRGYDVVDGEVCLSDDEYQDWLEEVYYEEVVICGYTFTQAAALRQLDPTAFRCGKNDYESEIQSELEEQLRNEDESDIDFIEEYDDEDGKLTDSWSM